MADGGDGLGARLPQTAALWATGTAMSPSRVSGLRQAGTKRGKNNNKTNKMEKKGGGDILRDVLRGRVNFRICWYVKLSLLHRTYVTRKQQRWKTREKYRKDRV